MQNLVCKSNVVMSFYFHKVLILEDTKWLELFENIEVYSKLKMTYLDEKDPLRNKISNFKEAAEYINGLNKNKNSWYIGGKIGKPMQIYLTIQSSKNKNEDAYPDKVSFCFEKINLQEEGVGEYLKVFFIKIIETLEPFYAICDIQDAISKKKKKTGFPINIQCELTGIFWLTYFNDIYSHYLGFDKLPSHINEKLNKGSLISLGKSLSKIEILGSEIEKLIGNSHFVDINTTLDKPIGKYVLTFEGLNKLD